MLLFLQSYYYKYKILQQVLLAYSLLCAVTNVTVKTKFYLQTSSNVGTYPYLYCTRNNHKLDINPPGKISLLNWRHNYYFSKGELNAHGRMSCGSAGVHRTDKPHQQEKSSIGKFSSIDLTVQRKAETITKWHWQVSEPQMRRSI